MRPHRAAVIDWEAFLARHDPIWHRLPETWMAGAFIGNGRLGAMIYRGAEEAEPPADVLAWTISRSDLYDDNVESDSWQDNYRLPVGRMHLCPVGTLKEGGIRIDLWNGEATGQIVTDKGRIEWRSWVAPGEAEQGVVVLVLDTEGEEAGVTVNWQPFRAIVPREHTRPRPDYIPNPAGHRETRGDVELWVNPLNTGGDYATAWKTTSLGETSQAVFMAIGDGTRTGGSADLAAAAVEAASGRGLAELQAENRDWWHAYYRKSFVSIPDARLESHYWIQMYKLASATREGSVIIDTCGPWLKVDTVWPACWWNLNLQLTHYPMAKSNHPELDEPLKRVLKQELEIGQLVRNAPEAMRHDSAYLGNPTTVNRLVNDVVYWRGKNITGRSRPAARLNHLPWICHTLWEHYRRSMDDAMLRDLLFPLTRRSYSFIFHFLEEGPDGRLHIKDTYSSEYGAADDANEAIAMVQWGCAALLWMCERLSVDDPGIPRWQEIQSRLVDPPTDENGLMIGADVPFEKPHRHYSHLMSLVPFRTWAFEDEEARTLAYRSLAHFLRTDRGLTGYSYTGASSMYSALGDGDRAIACLERYLKGYDRPNTMYTEADPASPVIETPLSAARSVQDMLLSSHDVIRIFPAVPEKWQDAAFYGLLAEGAFEVSAVRREGRTQFVLIKSLAGEPCRLHAGIEHPVRLTESGDVALAPDGWGVIELELASGEEALLVSAGHEGGVEVRPVATDAAGHNWYGLK